MDSRPGAGAAVPRRAAAAGPACRPRPGGSRKRHCFYKADVTWTWRKNLIVTMVECRMVFRIGNATHHIWTDFFSKK